ncbi:MAG TPA: peptide deformylase, partial [Porphyromonadaceae bacterium]|nr:peptide deformylase [Porphyromonadaceae bacterium]
LEEGCRIIPGVHEKVTRPDTVRIRYIDENRQEREEVFSGYAARCIQHEYDHLDGILFTDHISPLRKRMVNGKLNALANGKARCSYKVKTAK